MKIYVGITIKYTTSIVRACSGAVCWGTVLQARRSQVQFSIVSLAFFIDIILLAALCPWGQLSLLQKWVPGIFPGSKCNWCVGLTTLPPSCAKYLEIWQPQPPGTLWACKKPVQVSLYLYIILLLLFLWQMMEKLSHHRSGIPVEFDDVLQHLLIGIEFKAM